MLRSSVCVAVTLLTACQQPAAAGPPPSTAVPTNAVVERHVDGDTLVVRIDGRNETVRLIGIDTPETVKPDAPVDCFGPEASVELARLLPVDTPLHLERDVEARDDYGRLLAYVHRATDGLFVNVELAAGGYALPLVFEPNTTHAATIARAARDAAERGAGLWASCR